MRTILIATGLLVAAVALGLSFAHPKTAQGQASACENAEFRTGPSAKLPGCRAYEVVSPVDEPSGTPAGVATDAFPMPGRSSDDGNNIVYGAVTSIGEAESGVPNTFIFGKRTEAGWEAESAIRSADGEQQFGFSAGEPNGAWISPDARSLAFTISVTLGAPNPIAAGASIYRIDAGENTSPEWLSEPGEGVAPMAVSKDTYASRDLSTVVFRSTNPLNPGDPAGGGLYAWREGSLEFVAPGTVANYNLGNGASPTAFNSRNTVSADGRFVLFTPSNAGTQPLYVHDLETDVTHELAGPSDPAVRLNAGGWFGDPPAGPSLQIYTVPNGFVFGASDAPVAYFRSASNLTPEATGTSNNKMYRANLETGEVSFMPGLNGAPVAVSDDGADVMFLRPTGSGNNDPWELRHWSFDAPSDSTLLGSIPGTNNNSGMTRTFRSTSDGQTWLFLASGSLDPDSPNLKANAHQAYRWQVGDDHPTCLSCDSNDGVARLFGANLGPTDSYVTETIREPELVPSSPANNVRKVQGAQPNRAISTDGSIMAFDSPDRLVPGDTNNVRDVYMWDENETEGDQLRLLTSGEGKNPSYYVDMAPDGSNVFFTTQDELVEADIDKTYDVYVAREGGGIAVQQEPGCSGDSCQGPTPQAPENAPDGSSTYEGNGNPDQPRGQALLLLNKSVGAKAAKVRVRVNGPGRIVVSGRAIKRKALNATEPGTYRLKAKLKKKAAKKLRKGRKLKTAVRVSFRGEDGSKSRQRARVVFKKKAKQKRARTGARSGR